MPPSVYLARLTGPVLAVAGLGMLISPQHFMTIVAGFLCEPALIYLGALLGLLGGTAIVLAHNIWVADWRVIITLLGWISVVDSAAWLLLPQPMQSLAPALTASSTLPFIAGAVILLLGAVLCYVGYSASGHIGRRP